MAKHYSSDEPSPRELEVLRDISGGRSNKSVADRLQISEDTVKGHMRNILAKLGTNDRLDAVLIAMKRGVLEGWTLPEDRCLFPTLEAAAPKEFFNLKHNDTRSYLPRSLQGQSKSDFFANSCTAPGTNAPNADR
jgi:DNA-binding CsgD family transcriptional regulator